MTFQGNGLEVQKATEADTGIYACYLDNFVQPVVSYKFTLMVEGGHFFDDNLQFTTSMLFAYILLTLLHELYR